MRSGLPRERVWAKKFGMSFGPQGNQTFGRDVPGFCRHIPELPQRGLVVKRPGVLSKVHWGPFPPSKLLRPSLNVPGGSSVVSSAGT